MKIQFDVIIFLKYTSLLLLLFPHHNLYMAGRPVLFCCWNTPLLFPLFLPCSVKLLFTCFITPNRNHFSKLCEPRTMNNLHTDLFINSAFVIFHIFYLKYRKRPYILYFYLFYPQVSPVLINNTFNSYSLENFTKWG